MEKENYKAAYQLYWEYLKRSELYRDYCLWLREWYQEHNFPIGEYDLPPEFKDQSESLTQSHPVFHLYDVFGDIHSGNFEDWWEEHGRNIEEGGGPFKTVRRPKVVSNSSERVLGSFDRFVSAVEKYKNRQPTIPEIRNHLEQSLTDDPWFIHKSIDAMTLKEKVTVRIQSDKKTPNRRHWLNFRRSLEGMLSVNKIEIEPLTYYLSVYDMFHEKDENGKKVRTMVDVVNMIGKKAEKLALRNHPGISNEITKSYYRDVKKARKVIENTERGIFPGDY